MQEATAGAGQEVSPFGVHTEECHGLTAQWSIQEIQTAGQKVTKAKIAPPLHLPRKYQSQFRDALPRQLRLMIMNAS